MNVEQYRGAKVLFLILSGVGVFICKIIRKLFFPFKKNYFKNLKSSPFNAIVANNSYLLFTGRIKRRDYFQLLSIRTDKYFEIFNITNKLAIPVSYNDFLTRPFYNIRLGFVEKTNFLFSIFERYLNKIIPIFWFKKEKSIFNGYMLYDDYVTIYGQVKENPDIKNKYLDTQFLSLGNKYCLNSSYNTGLSLLSSIENLFLFNLIYFAVFRVITETFNIIKLYTGSNNPDRHVTLSNKTASNYRENCKRCNKYYKNVLFLKCNHFVFCMKCWDLTRRKCPLCNDNGVEKFLIFQD
jgi:hypothetical protein